MVLRAQPTRPFRNFCILNFLESGARSIPYETRGSLRVQPAARMGLSGPVDRCCAARLARMSDKGADGGCVVRQLLQRGPEKMESLRSGRVGRRHPPARFGASRPAPPKAPVDLSGLESYAPGVTSFPLIPMQQTHRSNGRPLPPVGHGPPIVSASGRLVYSTPSGPTSIRMRLSVDAAAQAAGREVVERVRAACDGDDHETLSTLGVLFPSVVERVPELHALMDELIRTGDDDAMRKICRIPGGRGRPRSDEFYFVAAVEQAMRDHGLDNVTDVLKLIAEAYKEARENEGGRPPFMPSQKTLQNAHSRLRDLFRLWSRSLWVTPQLLTARPWTPPRYVPQPVSFVATQLSRAIVFHSPGSTVTEPDKEHQNVETVPRTSRRARAGAVARPPRRSRSSRASAPATPRPATTMVSAPASRRTPGCATSCWSTARGPTARAGPR
jgi:hypothetical protein